MTASAIRVFFKKVFVEKKPRTSNRMSWFQNAMLLYYHRDARTLAVLVLLHKQTQFLLKT